MMRHPQSVSKQNAVNQNAIKTSPLCQRQQTQGSARVCGSQIIVFSFSACDRAEICASTAPKFFKKLWLSVFGNGGLKPCVGSLNVRVWCGTAGVPEAAVFVWVNIVHSAKKGGVNTRKNVSKLVTACPSRGCAFRCTQVRQSQQG